MAPAKRIKISATADGERRPSWCRRSKTGKDVSAPMTSSASLSEQPGRSWSVAANLSARARSFRAADSPVLAAAGRARKRAGSAAQTAQAAVSRSWSSARGSPAPSGWLGGVRRWAGSGPEAVVDGEPGDARPAGHGADAEWGGAGRRHQLARRRQDRGPGAIDPCLPLSEIVAGAHGGSLTDCMLTATVATGDIKPNRESYHPCR